MQQLQLQRQGFLFMLGKGMNEEEFDWCIEQTLHFGEDKKPLEYDIR